MMTCMCGPHYDNMCMCGPHYDNMCMCGSHYDVMCGSHYDEHVPLLLLSSFVDVQICKKNRGRNFCATFQVPLSQEIMYIGACNFL